MIEINIIILTIAFVRFIYKMDKEFSEQKKTAVKCGIQPFNFTLFYLFTGLYWLPMICYFLFRLTVINNSVFPFIVFISYVPGIVSAEPIIEKLECGYDFQRKAVKNIKEAQYVGWFGLFVWLVMWVITYFFISKS